MNSLVETLAHTWGGLVGAYGRAATRNASLRVEGSENIPAGACIWFSWHDTNLIALALHQRVSPRPAQAFVPPGLVGAGMRGWLDSAGFEWLGLPAEGTGNPQAALRAMRRGLAEHGDVVIAVDGPHGPRGIVKPGAFWLARVTGCPMLTVGFAARPSFRYPRWDRHLVPLPGARIAAVISKPVYVRGGQEIDGAFLDSIAGAMHAVRRRAQELL
jgi:lysophospholipid acyltransferase (LPLAT)-like uncharacterized protein